MWLGRLIFIWSVERENPTDCQCHVAIQAGEAAWLFALPFLVREACRPPRFAGWRQAASHGFQVLFMALAVLIAKRQFVRLGIVENPTKLSTLLLAALPVQLVFSALLYGLVQAIGRAFNRLTDATAALARGGDLALELERMRADRERLAVDPELVVRDLRRLAEQAERAPVATLQEIRGFAAGLRARAAVASSGESLDRP